MESKGLSNKISELQVKRGVSMSAEKIYTLAQQEQVREQYLQFKEAEKTNLNKIKELEIQIQNLQEDTIQQKKNTMERFKQRIEYKHFEEVLKNEEVGFEDVIGRIEMLMKLNFRDELSKEIIHVLLGEVILNTSDALKRVDMLKTIVSKTTEIDATKINSYIYSNMQLAIGQK